jgi:hypothetical protein
MLVQKIRENGQIHKKITSLKKTKLFLSNMKKDLEEKVKNKEAST